MLESDRDPKDIPQYVERAKDKDDPFRLMGFGHRVYKNFDPRAKIIRQACHELLADLDAGNEPLFEIAIELEQIALEDEYFIERSSYPNVDFYSGIILRALGIPLNMFTVMFAMARTVGWIVQWMEMMDRRSSVSVARSSSTSAPRARLRRHGDRPVTVKRPDRTLTRGAEQMKVSRSSSRHGGGGQDRLLACCFVSPRARCSGPTSRSFCSCSRSPRRCKALEGVVMESTTAPTRCLRTSWSRTTRTSRSAIRVRHAGGCQATRQGHGARRSADGERQDLQTPGTRR